MGLRHAWRANRVLVAVAGLAFLALVATYARDWRLPGLYMDAINPEYLIPGILHPPQPIDFAIPGNRLGDRWPVFTGTIYHGSTQLYAALPFIAVFGQSLGAFRAFQLLVGMGILVLVLVLSGTSACGPKRVVAVAAAGALALDPAFVLSLRTQGYSCMFPLLLLLGAVVLLRPWGERAPRWPWVLAAGTLYGLAVFSYFVYGFFLPALLWLVLRKREADARRPWHALTPWVVGCLVGYLPFIVGILLLRHDLGGTAQLREWLEQSGATLKPGEDDSGVLGRISTVVVASRRVFTGESPWLMILGTHRFGVFNALKADLLVLVPLIALAVARFVSRESLRAVAVPLALVLSFGAGSVVFGSRLDLQHYVAVLPLLYVGFGCACAMLWPRALAGPAANVARGAVVVGSLALILVTNVVAQQEFHGDLRATGGERLYTDAINRLAWDIDRTAPNATVYTPDWGFAMPIAFLSNAGPVRQAINPDEFSQQICAGKPQLVVFNGVDNGERVREVERLTQRKAERIQTWSQRDGVPAFQVARFAPGDGCA